MTNKRMDENIDHGLNLDHRVDCFSSLKKTNVISSNIAGNKHNKFHCGIIEMHSICVTFDVNQITLTVMQTILTQFQIFALK